MEFKLARFTVDGFSLKAEFPWQTPQWRWRAFWILFSFIFVFVSAIGGEYLAQLWLAPLIAYAAAAVGFNRTELRVDENQISWRDRPFPLRSGRTIALTEVMGWVYGVSPTSRRGSSSLHAELGTKLHVSFSVAIETVTGSIIRCVNQIETIGDAQEAASRFAKRTGKPCQERGPFPPAPKRFKWVMPLLTALFVVALFGMIIWSALQVED